MFGGVVMLLMEAGTLHPSDVEIRCCRVPVLKEPALGILATPQASEVDLRVPSCASSMGSGCKCNRGNISVRVFVWACQCVERLAL